MKNNILLARHGLQKEDGIGSSQGIAAQILIRLLEDPSSLENDLTMMNSIHEASREIKSPGPGMLVDPLGGDLPLTDFDPYIRGIVRWLNEVGIHTFGSCDGHGNRPAHIFLKKFPNSKQIEIIKAAVPASVNCRIDGKNVRLAYPQDNQMLLLEMAENLYQVYNNPGYLKNLQAENFKTQLIEWLNIPGASTDERAIRLILRNKLNRLVDHTFIDKKGNLLGFMECGTGPTILLSAHMDTVEEIVPDRKIIEEGTILRSSEGILGADDRAGIVSILSILNRVRKTNFNGTIKVAFTVEEEIGCRGSSGIDMDFIEDVDAAIVIDRRGNRDIVTSNAGFPFCPDEFGRLFEQAGKLSGIEDWQVTPGGISDAKVFANYDIPSVNLSAGYQNEHTDFETVDYLATFETVLLVESLLHNKLIRSEKNSQSIELL
ncbi:M20/M25/M40 family metallo-hydrolase [Mesobacillus boroniphilus]|uniref:M20/M25/M40 family metallo-hydrolase n=1 Tax=Mesobacillus boroniphilus TaxID=308892 RepID=A0A944CIW8_9BACI|nr:M20/M25/M40 family metallo-hydrolase [Mesobacillus boroniphilus]MBS8263863.1 M20/M25/M40 family metallo-hydrolase [Mesobacillus boroniphilus]